MLFLRRQAEAADEAARVRAWWRGASFLPRQSAAGAAAQKLAEFDAAGAARG